MKTKDVCCIKTTRPYEFQFIYIEGEEHIEYPEIGGVLMRDNIFGKNYDEVNVFVESDIAPIIIELMYDCLEEQKTFKVII